MNDSLQDLLELSYKELKARNLKIKQDKKNGKTREQFREEALQTLQNEEGVKAVMVAFSDLEGKLHLLDYDKEFVIGAIDNLTFDGSSVNGFSTLDKSDLRLTPDWSSMRWMPSDVFGGGKVLVFANVHDQDGQPFMSDFRAQLMGMTDSLLSQGITVNAAPEIEGFLFAGVDAEQMYHEDEGFEMVTEGGYFNTLPQDELRKFIDKVAEVQRAMGFENEKDHPEVAPSQFEVNFKYTDILQTCDQILLYKLVSRQVAKHMGYTASFLPKPVTGINGSGMHSNMSLEKDSKNVFYDPAGQFGLSATANRFLTGILKYAEDMCLSFCPSVNSYRRLDPNFEAPNEIKVSTVDRGSMIRVPLGNEKSARIEVRSVSPDSNPYLAYYLILSAGFKAMNASEDEYTRMKNEMDMGGKKILPGNIYDAIDLFTASEFITQTLGAENKKKYLELKQDAADRSPRALGTLVKNGEVLFHHEITNQVIASRF